MLASLDTLLGPECPAEPRCHPGKVGLGWGPGPPWEGGFLQRPLRTSSGWGGGAMLGRGDKEQEAQAGGIQPGPQPPPRRLPWAQSPRTRADVPGAGGKCSSVPPPHPPPRCCWPYPSWGPSRPPPVTCPVPLFSPHPSVCLSVSVSPPACPESSSSVEPACPFLRVASADAAVIVVPLALSS